MQIIASLLTYMQVMHLNFLGICNGMMNGRPKACWLVHQPSNFQAIVKIQPQSGDQGSKTLKRDKADLMSRRFQPAAKHGIGLYVTAGTKSKMVICMTTGSFPPQCPAIQIITSRQCPLQHGQPDMRPAFIDAAAAVFGGDMDTHRDTQTVIVIKSFP